MPTLQPSLFDRGKSIQERFERFHLANPEVYEALVAFAWEWKKAGQTKCGIRMLWERLRWEMGIRKDPNENYTLQDHYHSRFVRLLCANEPELAGMFELRTLKAD